MTQANQICSSSRCQSCLFRIDWQLVTRSHPFQSSTNHHKQKPCFQAGQTKGRRLMNAETLFLSHRPHSIPSQWRQASGRDLRWRINSLLPNERSSFFLLNQRLHERLVGVDPTRCTGFAGCLLGLCRGLLKLLIHAALFTRNHFVFHKQTALYRIDMRLPRWSFDFLKYWIALGLVSNFTLHFGKVLLPGLYTLPKTFTFTVVVCVHL